MSVSTSLLGNAIMVSYVTRQESDNAMFDHRPWVWQVIQSPSTAFDE